MKRQALFAFIITLMLISLLCIPMFAYTVNIGGALIERPCHAVSHQAIRVQSSPNDVFQIDTTVWTNNISQFDISLTIPDDVAGGTLILSVNHGILEPRMIRYHEGETDFKVLVTHCKWQYDRCGVAIKVVSSDSMGTTLHAQAKGQADIVYTWSTGDTTSSISTSRAGSYCIQTRDAMGCEASDCVVIGHPSCRTEIAVSSLSPDLNVGNILIARTKGVAPFTFKWSKGDTTAQIAVQSPGSYCLTVTDYEGCSSTDCWQFPRDRCVARILVSRADSATSDQVWKLTAHSVGASPLKYVWSTGETTQSIQVSDSTSYCVSVADTFGCTATTCVSVGNQECGTLIKSKPAVSDPAKAGRKVLCAFNEGLNPISYNWSTGDTSQCIEVDSAGTYCAKVVDATGCESTVCTEVNFSPCTAKIIISPAHSLTDAISGATGLSVRSRGTAPFRYLWSTGDTIQRIDIGDHRKYCVTVTDATGCEVETCLDLSTLVDSCTAIIRPQRSGFLVVATRFPYTSSVLWSTGDTTRRILVDSSGTYCVDVTNVFDCVTSACITIPIVDDSLCKVKILSRRIDEGTLLIAATRGHGKPRYEWNTGDTSRYVIVDSAGAYCVTVSSADHCQAMSCIDLPRASIFGSTMGDPQTGIPGHLERAYPNPFFHLLHLDLSLDMAGPVHVSVHEVTGREVWAAKYLLSEGSHSLSMDLHDLSSGIYILGIRGAHINKTKKMIKY